MKIKLWGGPLDGRQMEIRPAAPGADVRVPHVGRDGKVLSYETYLRSWPGAPGKGMYCHANIAQQYWPVD